MEFWLLIVIACVFLWSVSSTCRTWSHYNVKRSRWLCICPPRVLQLCSDLTAHWGLKSKTLTPKSLWFVTIICCICWCSFYARIQPGGFVTWSVSRCSPSFTALHLILSSFKRHLLTSSWSSETILIGQPKQLEDVHWMTLITSSAMKSFVLQLLMNRLLLLPTQASDPETNSVKWEYLSDTFIALLTLLYLQYFNNSINH